MRTLSKADMSLNTATLGWETSIDVAVRGCETLGIPGIDPWRNQMEAYGQKDAVRLIRNAGLEVTALCRGGFFTASDTAGRAAAMDDNRQAVELAAELDAACLVIVAGGVPDGHRLDDAHAQVADCLAELLDFARPVGVTLAIEPMHPMYVADRGCINTLAHAIDLCDTLGDGTGVAVDVYHTRWDLDLDAQIARAGDKNLLLGFHVCDWLRETSDMLLDRGMMGDGVIDLKKIRGWMEDAGYDGLIEVEIFSAENWWTRPADEVLSTCVERFASVV